MQIQSLTSPAAYLTTSEVSKTTQMTNYAEISLNQGIASFWRGQSVLAVILSCHSIYKFYSYN
jgi:hypothetical protein